MASSRRIIAGTVIATVSTAVVAVAAGYGVRSIVQGAVTENIFWGVRSTFSRASRAVVAAGAAWSGTEDIGTLRDRISVLESERAVLADVQEENEFLRRAAELPARKERRAVIGGVFAYGVAGAQIRMTVNRGSAHGVTAGSAVVTDGGVLVGVVDRVTPQSSAVRVLEDPGSQVTARIGGTPVSGLARVAPDGRFIFDLVAKDETVSEGALVISSGLDDIPAGLIIGTVRAVDPESTTLFQTVTVDAAYRDGPVDRVLILIP
ncbi:MAG TPA: rod shape-determining protein MreC [Candidatus Paceibacterota bacterium]|nr:rod shape-determining protein MreC [Candidatus Paceibacterota bacterium]